MSVNDNDSASSGASTVNNVDKSSESRFRNFLSWLKFWCSCSKKHKITAVDSVRLVYMRRIEDAELNSHTRILHRGRIKRESDLEALEKALREYESKNKLILSKTALPGSFLLRKESRISRYNAASNDASRIELGNCDNNLVITNKNNNVRFEVNNMYGDGKNEQDSSADETL